QRVSRRPRLRLRSLYRFHCCSLNAVVCTRRLLKMSYGELERFKLFAPYTKWRRISGHDASKPNIKRLAVEHNAVIEQAPDERGRVHPLGRTVLLTGSQTSLVHMWRALSEQCMAAGAPVSLEDASACVWQWREGGKGVCHGPFSWAQLQGSQPGAPARLLGLVAAALPSRTAAAAGPQPGLEAGAAGKRVEEEEEEEYGAGRAGLGGVVPAADQALDLVCHVRLKLWAPLRLLAAHFQLLAEGAAGGLTAGT
ncbi:hypothetical protein QJQ45_014880, partial [Haematococcus lacustris]